MNNKDYNLDNYTNDELFEIFELDKRKDSMTNLKTLDTFMKKFLSKSSDENMREFMQNAGKKVIKIYLTNLQDLNIQEMLSIFNISSPVSNVMNMEYEAMQYIEKNEGYVRIYLENVLNKLVEKLAIPEKYISGKAEIVEQSLYLDSRFRDNLLSPSNGTLFHLPEIKHVVSLQLNYIEVPLCWKLFDDSKQNNFFLIDISSNEIPDTDSLSNKSYNTIKIDDDVFNNLVDPDPNQDKLIVEVMRKTLQTKINEYSDLSGVLFLKKKGNKLHFDCSGTKYIHIVFHDVLSPTFSKISMNQTLGWKLGFRKTDTQLHGSDISSCFADAYVSLHTRSLFLQLDDYTSGSSEHPVVLPITTHQDRHNHTFRDSLKKLVDDKGSDLKIKQFLKTNDTYILDHIHVQTNKKMYTMLMRNDQYSDAGDLVLADMQQYTQNYKSFHLHHKDTFAVIDLHKTPIDSILAGQTLTEYYDENDFTKLYADVTLSKIRLSILDEQGEMVDFQGEDFKLQLKLKKYVQPNVIYSKYQSNN